MLVSERQALIWAQSHGLDVKRLPWFGVFLQDEKRNHVTVICAYRSIADAAPSIGAALESLDPSRAGTVSLLGSGFVAGRVPS